MGRLVSFVVGDGGLVFLFFILGCFGPWWLALTGTLSVRFEANGICSGKQEF